MRFNRIFCVKRMERMGPQIKQITLIALILVKRTPQRRWERKWRREQILTIEDTDPTELVLDRE